MDYHVFVTTLCQQPVLLFVIAKTARGPRCGGTLDGGPAECSFDYRVTAKRLDYEDMRLEQANCPEGSEVR